MDRSRATSARKRVESGPAARTEKSVLAHPGTLGRAKNAAGRGDSGKVERGGALRTRFAEQTSAVLPGTASARRSCREAPCPRDVTAHRTPRRRPRGGSLRRRVRRRACRRGADRRCSHQRTHRERERASERRAHRRGLHGDVGGSAHSPHGIALRPHAAWPRESQLRARSGAERRNEEGRRTARADQSED